MAQRRSLDEVQGDLFPGAGNRREKSPAFWGMLVLATMIAARGAITNSMATVVGAMIIAPLGTPIFGAAAGAFLAWWSGTYVPTGRARPGEA